MSYGSIWFSQQHSFLAPSGAAAALIDGMTIHKGLFIKVRKKGNCVPGESEDYGIIMSVSD